MCVCVCVCACVRVCVCACVCVCVWMKQWQMYVTKWLKLKIYFKILQNGIIEYK